MNRARIGSSRVILEAARWVAMIVGASCAVVAATWFRTALWDDDWSLMRAKELSAIVTFVVASALFLRAYWAGTQRREMPE